MVVQVCSNKRHNYDCRLARASRVMVVMVTAHGAY